MPTKTRQGETIKSGGAGFNEEAVKSVKQSRASNAPNVTGEKLLLTLPTYLASRDDKLFTPE